MIVMRFLIILLLLANIREISSHSMAAERISRIETLNDPTLSIHNNIQQPTTTTKTTIIRHSDTFTLRFNAFDTFINLHLIPNLDLFHPDATLLIYGKNQHNDDDDDIMIEEEKPLHPHEHRIYKGDAKADDGSTGWARIIIRDDDEHTYPYPLFEGAFMLGSDIYHIKTTTNFHLSKRNDDPFPSNTNSPMVIYRDSDIQQKQKNRHLVSRAPEHDDDFMCAMEEMQFNQKLTGIRNSSSTPSPGSAPLGTALDGMTGVLGDKNQHHASSTHHLEKRFSSLSGCPSTRKIAYMGAVADCTYVQSYGSIRFARLQIMNDWNVASAVYERTFNISLGLIYVQMSQPDCPRHPRSQQNWNQECSAFYTINDRLSDFSLWRGKRGDDGAALWHLMTKCSTGVKVGIAWLSQLCESQVSQQIEENGASEWVSGTGVSSITRDEWKVVAHEIGHGFGAIHDCTAQTCPCSPSGCSCCPLSDTKCSAGDTYLMNPTSNVTSEDFSPCSISDICGSFPNIGYCLQSPDLRDTTSFTMCGNGILEPGEECDSGLTDSACCHASTCKLKQGAVCDDYSQQCCLNCTVAPSTAMCRPAVSECDIPEYCTGESLSCPKDEYQENGSLCANGTMKCASGVCTSRDEQCIARGMRLGVTEECSFQKDSCQISCADPMDPGNCLVLSGVFLDGTECGLASLCEKGSCVSTGALNTLKAWVAQNKKIAIPVFLFGSLIVLGLLGWLAWFLISRHRRNRLASKDKDSRPSSIANSSSYRMDDMGGNGGGGERGHRQQPDLIDTAITIRRTLQQPQSVGFHHHDNNSNNNITQGGGLTHNNNSTITSSSNVTTAITANNNNLVDTSSSLPDNHNSDSNLWLPTTATTSLSSSLPNNSNNNNTENNNNILRRDDSTVAWSSYSNYYPSTTTTTIDTHPSSITSSNHRRHPSEGGNTNYNTNNNDNNSNNYHLSSSLHHHSTETTNNINKNNNDYKDASLHGSTSTARRIIGFHQGKQQQPHEMSLFDTNDMIVDVSIASEGQRHRRAKSTGA
ncbi:Metallo-peptidase family M12-domain-containing protein [Phascolomyces articulosus]|uniref:Disintegrin and metalloproteinase domain-containing protein B n=1 Tax=Phascolomyces articulosus TaxID=60185 RepID=A0AAD5JNV7_9FUNG|nr:Metallo-peptidase family M12-domain-containing protein [Phascolomyces articulosus]